MGKWTAAFFTGWNRGLCSSWKGRCGPRRPGEQPLHQPIHTVSSRFCDGVWNSGKMNDTVITSTSLMWQLILEMGKPLPKNGCMFHSCIYAAYTQSVSTPRNTIHTTSDMKPKLIRSILPEQKTQRWFRSGVQLLIIISNQTPSTSRMWSVRIKPTWTYTPRI